jgi:hypothetical protein
MEETMRPEAQIATFRRLFLSHCPPHQAWMQPAGAPAKYLKKFHAITDVELAAHLAGGITLAAPLIGADERARGAALDIDTGGAPALGRILDAARQHALTAFAVSSSNDDHDGGHVWLLFDAPADPPRLRQLAQDLSQATGVAAETYPTRKTLRLPLGVHRWTSRRGTLLLPDDWVVDLDVGQDAIATALARLAALPLNAVAALPALTPGPSPAARQRPPAAPGHARWTISGYNQGVDLVALLESYGGQVVERYLNGGALMACPCGGHAHADQHPSLEVRPASSARYGRHVAYGYAPACIFHTAAGQVVDAFGVFCRLEQLTPAEAIRQLARAGHGIGRQGATAPASQAAAPEPRALAEEGGAV